MADYSKAIIYTIRSKDSIYVGSTINFISRKNQHKACIYNENSPKYNHKLYKIIRENDGEWSMRPYRAFPCNSKMELTIEEERIRCELNANLNMRSCGSGLTEKEYLIKYRENNKEKISEIGRQYREENKDKIKENKKQYYQENKEKISEQLKQYREENKEKISEQKKEKITCECGSICRKSDLARHKRSKKHLDWEKLK